MRFYPKNFDAVATKAKFGSIKGILLYGPDKGMISHFLGGLQKALGLSLRKVPYADKASVQQLANSLSLFADKEIIVLENCGSSLDKEGKQAFEGTLHNFLVFVADELAANSSLRQFFEKHESLASIACYADLKSDLQIIVKNYLANAGKSIDNDALDYVCDNLNNDRQILYGELDKLIIHTSQTRINLKSVQDLIMPSRSFAIDKLCINLANNDAAGYFNELDNLFAANVPEILIIRSLIKYYTNVYMTKRRVIFGASLDEAVKQLSPPLFFMYASAFKAIVQKTSVPEALSALKKLNLSEIELKSTNKNSRNVFENIFY